MICLSPRVMRLSMVTGSSNAAGMMVVEDGYLKVLGKLNLGYKDTEENILRYNWKAAGSYTILW